MIDYQDLLNDEFKTIPPSGIRKFFSLAMQSEGATVLAIGEPDFKTPWRVRQAAITALEKGRTWYTANAGMPQLLDAISKYQKRRFNLEYSPSEIFVTVGASEAIDICFRTLLNEGDEVIIPTPAYVSYSPLASLCKAKIVEVTTLKEDDFKLTAEQVKNAITDKTKILMLPFPSNPTGAVMDLEDYKAIAEVIKDTDIIVVTDEIYAELTYGKKHVSFASVKGMKDRTIVMNGFSKSHAMTGWRLGYVMGPENLISSMIKLHQYVVICAPTVSQYAAIVALNECDDEVESMRDEYDTRRKYLVGELNRMGLSTHDANGTFYVFCDIRSTGLSSETFCERLLFEADVVVVPGSAFGNSGEGFVRISYAYSLNHIVQGLEKIEEFIAKLKQNG